MLNPQRVHPIQWISAYLYSPKAHKHFGQFFLQWTKVPSLPYSSNILLKPPLKIGASITKTTSSYNIAQIL